METPERIRLMPRYYLVVSGVGRSSVSPINAFDRALKEAGIHDVNLIEVSSILPKGVKEMRFHCKEEITSLFEPGEFIHVVMAKRLSSGRETIAAGLMWGEGVESHGFVIEHTLSAPYNTNIEMLRERLLNRLKASFQEGIRIRGIRVRGMRHKTVEASIPERTYGCALAALILC